MSIALKHRRADPGYGERMGAGRFTLKLMVIFKDFFQFKKCHGQFQRFV
jgi:hypothetical protein